MFIVGDDDAGFSYFLVRVVGEGEGEGLGV